jgi:hypothetical protein
MTRLYKMKYDFYKNDEVYKDAIVEWVTVINDYYLVEDVITKKRAWVSKYDIQMISDD